MNVNTQTQIWKLLLFNFQEANNAAYASNNTGKPNRVKGGYASCNDENISKKSPDIIRTTTLQKPREYFLQIKLMWQ